MLAPALAAGCSTASRNGTAASRVQTAPAESPAPSGPDLAPVDVTVDPCTDFARFACGSGDRNLRANDAVAWRRPAIERFMTEIAAGQHADPAHGTPLLREFYLRCTDRGARAAGLAGLRAQLDDLAHVPTLAELARRLGRLRARGTRLLIDFTPERPPGQTDGVVAAHIGLASPRLPRRLYAPVHELVRAYHRHWEVLARLSGAVTAREVDAAARIDAWLATGGPTTPAAADSWRTLTAAELAQARFPWSAYLSALDPRVPGPFLIHSAQALARVDALADLPLAELRSYARVLLIEQWAEFLVGAFLDEELRFHAHAGHDAGREPAPANLPASCAALAARDLTPLLADAYLSEMPNPAGEEAARRMFDRLRARLDRRVQRADWIDETAREPARKRLGEVGLVFVEDVEAPAVALASPPGSFLDLYRRTRDRDARRTLALVGRPWAEEPLTPTLSPGEYFSRPNRVWVSPEIVRPPYLRAQGLNAISFGALGAVMGHEIAHAIPAMLQSVGTAPTDRPRAASRAPETAAGVSFSARLACLKRRLDSMSPPEAAADSRHRLGESWADRVGVDLALEAMDDEAATAGQARPLEAWQRDFFVAYAQTLCTVQGDGAPEIDALRDPHAPARSRINSVVADAPEFARAFACRADAPMAPVQRCSAW